MVVEQPNATRSQATSDVPETTWNVLTNHGHVLVCIAADHDSRLRDIAAQVGITERAVFGIVEDLERAGMIRRSKVGRRNRYEIDRSQSLRHDIVARRTVGDLLDALHRSPAGAGELNRT